MVGPAKTPKAGEISSLIKPKKGGDTIVIDGPADGATITQDESNGVKVFCGLRDDPFFFDLIFGERKRLALSKARPSIRAHPASTFLAGINVSIICVELPFDLIKGKTDPLISFWATTSRATSTKRSQKSDDVDAKTFAQVDIMGKPAINVVVINPKSFRGAEAGNSAGAVAHDGDNLSNGDADFNGNLKDKWNRTEIVHEKALFRDVVLARIAQLTGKSILDTYVINITDTFIIPDFIPYDHSKATNYKTPFPDLPNGRKPTDDVIDKMLEIFLNVPGATDNVNANDVPFLSVFPYFAPPHTAAEGVPQRDK